MRRAGRPGAMMTPVSCSRRGSDHRCRVWQLAAASAVVAAVMVSVVASCGGEDPPGAELRVVVPAGTWDRIRAGEAVELIPRRLELATGDTLVIVNDDSEAHQVGPYVVSPGETLTQFFPDPGVIARGLCTLHPDGRVEIVIVERT